MKGVGVCVVLIVGILHLVVVVHLVPTCYISGRVGEVGAGGSGRDCHAVLVFSASGFTPLISL